MPLCSFLQPVNVPLNGSINVFLTSHLQADASTCQSLFPEVQSHNGAFCPVPSSQDPELPSSHSHYSHCNPDLHISPCLFLFMRSNRAPLSTDSLIICIRKSSIHSRKLLDWPPHWPSSRCHGSSRPTWGPGPVNIRLLPVIWRRRHLLLLPNQPVYSRHPKQCYPLIPICSQLAHHASQSKASHIPAHPCDGQLLLACHS